MSELLDKNVKEAVQPGKAAIPVKMLQKQKTLGRMCSLTHMLTGNASSTAPSQTEKLVITK